MFCRWGDDLCPRLQTRRRTLARHSHSKLIYATFADGVSLAKCFSVFNLKCTRNSYFVPVNSVEYCVLNLFCLCAQFPRRGRRKVLSSFLALLLDVTAGTGLFLHCRVYSMACTWFSSRMWSWKRIQLRGWRWWLVSKVSVFGCWRQLISSQCFSSCL